MKMKIDTRDMIIISLFAALMAVGAYLKIPNPFNPLVPITLQLFFCLFAGLLLGGFRGIVSQLIYITIGLVGVPVFAGGGGYEYVVTPTFGFIIGFVFCAGTVGFIIDHVKELHFGHILGASLLGLIIAYAVGIVYMQQILKVYSGKELTLIALTLSMVGYIIKDVVLVVIASIAATRVIPVLRKAGY